MLTAKAFCYGIRPSEAALNQLGQLFNEKGFIHGVPIQLESGRIINTALFDEFVKTSPSVPLDFNGDGFFLLHEGHRVFCRPVGQPDSLYKSTPFGGLWVDIVRFHAPQTLFVTPLRECVFATQGEICQFCTFVGDAMKPSPVSPVADKIIELIERQNGDLNVAIGSGTPNRQDYGARYFAHLAELIFDRTGAGISVEMVPPKDTADLQLLKDAGVSSLIMSIEVWDEEKRVIFCPGKSEVSKSQYIEAWTEAVSLFGRGQVSSVVLVGLDSNESVIRAIDELTSIGVVPTIIPFRPYDECELRGVDVTLVDDYVLCSRHNAEALLKQQLSPFQQSGCTKCQGCSIDAPDFWEHAS